MHVKGKQKDKDSLLLQIAYILFCDLGHQCSGLWREAFAVPFRSGIVSRF